MKKANTEEISDKELMELYKADLCKGNAVVIEQYKNYVYDMIHKNYPTYKREIEDLYQAGCEGLMKALKGYDANKGAFYNYCYEFIHGELNKHIRFLNGESSVYYASLHQKIIKAENEIEARGEKVTVEKIMQITGLSRKIVRRELLIDYNKVSFDALDNYRYQ